MAKYMERETVIKAIENDCLELVYYTKEDAIQCVKAIPAADVVEVRHERWEEHGSKWQCTGCKVLMSIDGTPQENMLYYCPQCGAKMDKEKEYGCDFAKQMGFSKCDKCPIDCDIRQMPKEENHNHRKKE